MPVNTLSKKYSMSTALAFCTLLLFIAAYYPAMHILTKKWATSEEYGHAFLTIPIILHMAWLKRGELTASEPTYTSLGLTLILIATPLYIFALLTEIHTVITLSMMITLWGTLIYLSGIRSIRMLITPLLLLLFLIPVPTQLYIELTFPLQLMVSKISENIIRIFNVPIFREGNIMMVPGKSFEVAGACSGLRSLISLLTLSIIMGHYMLKKNTFKLLLIAASIPTAILVNIFRVVATVLLFNFFQLDLSEGIVHEATGLVVFILALLILFLSQKYLENLET